jgi:hypothetical protein
MVDDLPSSKESSGFAVSLGDTRFLLGERTLIGRGASCDLWLDDDALVSRRHARLTVCAHGVVLEDLASRNGVYVDGERIDQSKLLVGGETVRVGATELTLVPLSLDRRETRLDWDDDTVSPRKYPSRTRVSAVTDGVEAFDVVLGLTRFALDAGDAERAERIVGGHLHRLANDARAGMPLDAAKIGDAISVALALENVLASGEWIAFVLELHASTGTLLSSALIDRLYDLVRHVERIDVAALTRYLDVLAAQAVRFGPSETFRLRRVQGLASLLRVG